MMKIIICTALVVSCSKMFLEHINDNNRCFILKWPPSDSLAFVIRHKHNKWGSNNVHYLEKFPSLLFNFLHLLFEVFLGPRPIGCDPLEMHMLQLTRFWGHLNQQQSKRKKKPEQQKAEEKCQIEFEHYSDSHVCVFVSDVSVKINRGSSVPKNPLTLSSINTKARGGGGHKYVPECALFFLSSSSSSLFFFFFFFFFIVRGKNRRKRESRHSSELNAFFKVELNFVQNPPGGRHYWKPFPLKMSAAPPLAWLSLAYIWPAFVWSRLGLQLEGWEGKR